MKKKKKLNLLQSQRLMASLVMRPLTKNWELNKKWTDGKKTADIVAPLIKPNDRLTSLERIEIYNKQYWFRLIECFSDDFPGLRAILGEDTFDQMTIAYIQAHPSRSYSLRNLGQHLTQFLEKNPRFIKPHTRLALDMARFEWAQVEAFDGPGKPPLTSDDIAALPADPAKVNLALQPYVQLLHLAFPLDHFLTALKRKDAALRREASNAIDETTSPPAKKRARVNLPKPRETFLAVHRFENVLYYKRLTPESYATLANLRDGLSLESALEKAIVASKKPSQDWSSLIQQWFNEWTQLGWLCKFGEKK